MSFWDSEVILGEIEKNSKEKFIIKKVSTKGKFYLDIRLFYTDASNEYKPTTKGVVISFDKVDELYSIINTIRLGDI